MARNIILVGFMGTGKSSAGRIVARRLGREFVDMDTVIESRQSKSIPEIFAQDGEPAFRQLERDLVKELAAREDLVVAPGGGIVLSPDNVAEFGRTGLVICLQASPEAILRRVAHEAHRPLLQGGDKIGRIRELLARRQTLYDAIDLQVHTDGMSPEDVAERVVELYDASRQTRRPETPRSRDPEMPR